MTYLKLSIAAGAAIAIAVAVSFIGALPAEAEDGQSADAAAAKVLARLKAVRPDLPIESVAQTPIEGIVALHMPGGNTLYGTEDGNYLFVGDLYHLGATDLVNVTDQRRNQRRAGLLEGLDTETLIVFAPEGETRATLNVFTDVDCGYCRKLHDEVPELNAMGIAVRYLAYPRAGIGSGSYDKVVSAWCAKDQQTAITRLKAGQNILQATCSNPVAQHYQLGQEMGVTGTPAIVLESGRLLPGYMPAADLAAAIGVTPNS